jgi:PAS domain S-box-containing protein
LRPLTPRWPACTTESAALELSGPKTAEEVYGGITKPYDYTEGYHFLMKVLPFRFEKNDILRIVRALAIFRPSLIALQMPLTEEDEIFVEKCVQRSVIELNKLISYSGTPTVVWRRTGEICLVGPEFCMLTGWSKEELLGTKKYIWEIFENQSVVEYWENFATHAFENAAQSVYSHCVLLKPNGSPVPATFCFHIRRDIFDLPSLVIGQWLPLL